MWQVARKRYCRNQSPSVWNGFVDGDDLILLSPVVNGEIIWVAFATPQILSLSVLYLKRLVLHLDGDHPVLFCIVVIGKTLDCIRDGTNLVLLCLVLEAVGVAFALVTILCLLFWCHR